PTMSSSSQSVPEFFFPVAREDLQKRAPRQFYVSEVFGAHSLPARLKDCRGLLQSHRSLFPLHGFNALYSLLCHWQDIAQSAKEDAWDILAECCHFTVVSLAKSLGDVTGDSPGMSSDERCHARNALKMLMFLVTQQLELFEADLGSGKPIPGTKKGRKKKASSAACAEMIRLRWDDEVSGLVEQVKQLCLLQLHMLWEPPVIEEDFVNLIGDLCFRVLDNPSFIRIQEVREPVTSILTRLVRSYNYSRTGAIKLSQLLVMCEQPQPNQVVHLVNGFLAGQQNDMRCFVSAFLQELASYSSADLEKNTAGTGALCTFLVEFTQLHPDIAEQSLPHFKERLACDPYSLRNCVLSMISSILSKRYLSNSELDSKQRAKVDRYLDTLEEHVHDLNGFVRSRCLQIWLQIVEAKSLPYERMGRLVELIAGPQGSLLDTSAMARKHSMKILAAMLECNPAVRVPTDQLNADFEREVKILQELEASQDPELVQKELTWRRRIIPKVLQLLSQQVRSAAAASATDAAEAPAAARAADGDDSEGDAAAEDEEEEGIGEEETAEAVARRIYDNFQRNRVSRAIRLFALAHDAFTDNPIFSTRIEEVPNSDSQPASASQAEAQAQKLRVQAWTDRLKDIYMGEAYAANSRQSEACAQIAKQQTLIACLRQSLQFVEQVKSAIPFVVAMLGSSTQSDILEAVAFLLAGHQQGMAECAPGFKKMLGLVWSKEAAIKQAVVSAYEKMYTEVFVDQDAGIGPDEAEKLRVSAIVGSLSQLICSATLGDLLSLEKLVCEFVRSGVIDKPVVQGAWDKFARRAGNSSQDRRAAVILLGMMAAEEPGIVRANTQLLVSEGLCADCTDLQLVQYTCVALQRMAATPAKAKSAANAAAGSGVAAAPESCRMPTESDLFQRLLDIIVSSASGESRFWMPMMEQAVSVIYTLADSPDQLAASLIRRMARLLLDCSRRKSVTTAAEAAEPADAIQMDDADAEAADAAVEMSDDGPEAPQPSLTLASSMLAKFVALVGHVALKVLVHLEVAVLAELKRRTALKEANKGGETGRASAVKASKRKSVQPASAEDELGLEGASADDQEAEQIRRLLDDVLLYDERHLLSHLAPLIVHVCEQPASFQSEQLQAAASLALAKLMLVSGKFCEQHLGLLFTLAEKSQSEVIRANLIVALGDLAKRFPNLVEPWTASLYGRLRDSSARVRLNALNTLSHLILNDMIKVKGQISEMTTCICDSQSRIAHLAKLFFSELSNKGNALYNVLPDIINRLSDAETHEDHFKEICDFLFPLIRGDRHCEQLVEKLCIRLRSAEQPRQWRDFAYCLNLMTYSERMLRKLLEHICTLADKLHETEVYNCFKAIAANAGRAAPQGPAAAAAAAAAGGGPGDLAGCLAELNAKIEEFHLKQVDNEEAMERAEKAAEKAAKKAHHRRKRSSAAASGANAAAAAAAAPAADGAGPSGAARGGSKRRAAAAARRRTAVFSDSESE
ncbi:hypothetical protein BOX15_Mlig031913g1, partial [Macrostomum lignano]